jgi:hypothetical protein
VRRTFERLAVVVLVVVLGARPGGAQDAPARDPLLDRLVGTWTVDAGAQGGPAEFVAARWTLGDRFLSLAWTHAGGGAAPLGEPYDAQAYLRPAGPGRLDGTWLDSTGAMGPLTGLVAGDTLTLERPPTAHGPARVTLTLTHDGAGDGLRLAARAGEGGAWTPVEATLAKE